MSDNILQMRANSDLTRHIAQPVRLLDRTEKKTKSMFLRLLDITKKSFTGIQLPPEEVFKARYLNDDMHVKEWGGTVVGYALVSERERQPYIVSIAVDPPSRGCGVAHQLLKAVIERARWAKKDSVSLTCTLDNPAQKVYFDCGFRVVGVAKGFYDEDGDGLMMKIELSQLGEKHEN